MRMQIRGLRHYSFDHIVNLIQNNRRQKYSELTVDNIYEYASIVIKDEYHPITKNIMKYLDAAINMRQ